MPHPESPVHVSVSGNAITVSPTKQETQEDAQQRRMKEMALFWGGFAALFLLYAVCLFVIVFTAPRAELLTWAQASITTLTGGFLGYLLGKKKS